MLSLQLQAISPNACRILGHPYRASGPVRACQLQAVIRRHGPEHRSQRSEILRCEPRMLREARQHARAELILVMKGEDDVRPALTLERPM